ncbi:sensor protein FixL [mine drainage metagenome]|uniref:Sensor protein FixL n=1 Tax=mine drainage metagenome TaxID=410659 RepID=A0A1J5R999_9ZZZZ
MSQKNIENKLSGPHPSRIEAEASFSRAAAAKPESPVADELLIELKAYQLELETQNKSLNNMQLELEKSRDRYLDLYDSAPVGYLTLSPDGLISEINLTAAKMLGVARNNLIQRRFAQFVAAEDGDRWHRFLMHLLQYEGKSSLELAIRRDDGVVFHAWLDCLRVAGDETEPSVRIAFTDISRRQEVEDALQRSERKLVNVVQSMAEHQAIERRLQERRAERESLLSRQVAVQTASAIAHELNQPLTAISAYSEMALYELGSGQVNYEKLSRALGGCVDQAQRAGRSLHELLGFLHKGELVSESMDLNGIVSDAFAIAQSIGYGGFNPRLELEPGLPLVLGNRIQVQKVLVNLVRNGVEAMRVAGVSDGAITVAAGIMEGANMVRVTVEDEGPGLDAETAKRVFEPFFTTKSGGVGLGLAISRSLIEANGGELWLETDARAGAAFHFTLPFAS